MIRRVMGYGLWVMGFFIFLFSTHNSQLIIHNYCYAQETKEDPIIVNGDTVEYSTDAKEVTVTGNASVIYKDTKLTCHKLTVNTQTKDAEAEGNARLEQKDGTIEGSKIKYNFQTQAGTIIDSEFRVNPYFGKSQKLDKVSDEEFIAKRGYMTTCSYDSPHYRIKSRRMNIFPDDKVQTKDDVLYLGRIPLGYIPQYNHSLKDPLMHTQFLLGKDRNWKQYFLTATRINLSENISARIYLDYRQKFGIAEGFGLNYTTDNFGKGDYKYYYTRERSRWFQEGDPAEFQRYLIRWRHQGNIDEQTNLTLEYYKIVDSKNTLYPKGLYNFLKEYFLREYQNDTLPSSYILLHRAFKYSNLDFSLQKRVNRWYAQTEKLPEIKYSFANRQIAESPFYLQHDSSYANSNTKQAVPSASSSDVTENNISTTNKLSMPVKAAFFRLNPFASGQETFSDKGTFGSTSTVALSTGSDLSTKFYRFFNVKSNFLGLDMNNLRHIVSPGVGYSYSRSSTMPNNKPRFGVGGSFGTSSMSMDLSNKLQTKRKGQSVDLVDFNVTNSYSIKPKTGAKRGSSLSDFLFKLKLLPYSWLRINADTTLNHSGRYSEGYKHFSNVNYDFNFDFGPERSFMLGQRYQRKGGNEIAFDLDWRISPKWKFGAYQRRNRGHDPRLKRGIREQEYFISRDLHCWIFEATYNVRKGEGETVWFICRLKAFPELEFEYNQMYHAPKAGSQSNP